MREFRREDFETLWEIDQQCFPPGIAYSRFELSLYIRRRTSFTIVAEAVTTAGGSGVHPHAQARPAEILGFIVGETERSAGHIITIDVVDQARRSGVGSKLLNGAEDRLRAVHCRRVYLETAVDNRNALAFYKRHEYRLVKTVPRYYSNGLDALVLEKPLA